MGGQKDEASEVMEIAVTVSDALDDFDRVVAALGEAVGVRTGKGIEVPSIVLRKMFETGVRT